MYDASFEDRSLIPEGRFCEVAYEELDAAPSAWSDRSMRDWPSRASESRRPCRQGYFLSIVHYRKNRHADLLELHYGVASPRKWGRSFDAWGYER